MNIVHQMAYSLPTLVAVIAGLMMTSIFRPRSPEAANLAMWCLIAMLLNLILGPLMFGVLGMAGGLVGDNIQFIYMAVNFCRQIINAAATVGLVYAAFVDREQESVDEPDDEH